MNQTRIEYVKLIQHCTPCEHIHETSIRISADCIYEFDTQKIIQQEVDLVRAKRIKNVIAHSIGIQKDDEKSAKKLKITQETQTPPKTVGKSVKGGCYIIFSITILVKNQTLLIFFCQKSSFFVRN